jgi:hypothetical protein
MRASRSGRYLATVHGIHTVRAWTPSTVAMTAEMVPRGSVATILEAKVLVVGEG